MKKLKIPRSLVLLIVFFIMFSILIVRLFQLQIVKGQEYENNFILQTKREIVLSGARGNIYDRNGKPLATNKLANSVTFEDQETYNSDRERQLNLNSKIYQMIRIIKSKGDSIETSLKIIIDPNGNFQFSVDDFWLQRFKADVYGKANIDDMEAKERNSTADEIVSYLSDKFCVFAQGEKKYTDKEKKDYGLPQQFEKSDLLDILNIRYALSLQAYQKYLSVTVVKDVSDETVAAIMENQYDISGVDIKQDTIRVYEGGEACSSILGYTGTISSEELKERDDSKLTINSIVGKSGMEQYLDQVLQGRDGKKEVYVDNTGRTTQDLGVIQQPRAGKDVYLSIDVELQKKTYEALERKIADILVQHLINTKTFDKKGVDDTTEIKIPIYDVYIALLNNGVIDLEQLREEDASELERKFFQIFLKKKSEVVQGIEKDLRELSTKYNELGIENQEYQSFIIDNLNIINNKNNNEELVEKWEKGELSMKDYLYDQIGVGNINSDIIASEEEYLNKDEIYESLVSFIVNELQENSQFDELINKYLVLNDEILPDDIVRLLYEQQFLNPEDEDYENWNRGLITTFDLLIKKIQKLEITPADLALDPCSGSAVVTDTATGKVLACVSYPGYDNNRLANNMDTDYYRKLNKDLSTPFYNKATQERTAPGSTFKPVTAIAGLSEGVITDNDYIYCGGRFDKLQGAPLNCWLLSGHGALSIRDGIANSCNVFFSETAYRLGQNAEGTFNDNTAMQQLIKYANLLGLDKKSGLEISEASPQVSNELPIPSAIGQGTHSYTTSQLARYATVLASSGNVYNLSLLDKSTDSDGNLIEDYTPEMIDHVELSQGIWDDVHVGMEGVITKSNWGIFQDLNVTLAGKTGTAQQSKNRANHSLFIGYAPADKPQIAWAIRIANGYASTNSELVAKDILNYYFGLKDETEILTGQASTASNSNAGTD